MIIFCLFELKLNPFCCCCHGNARKTQTDSRSLMLATQQTLNTLTDFTLSWTSANIKNTASPANQPTVKEALSALPSNFKGGVCSRVFVMSHESCYVKTLGSDYNSVMCMYCGRSNRPWKRRCVHQELKLRMPYTETHRDPQDESSTGES